MPPKTSLRDVASAISLAATTLVCACAAHGALAPPNAAIAESWTRVDDDSAAPHFPTLVLAGNKAFGYSGCSPWRANLTAAGAALRFWKIRLTASRCEAQSARAVETDFLRALARTRSLRRNGDELTLLDAGGEALARFVPDDTAGRRAAPPITH